MSTFLSYAAWVVLALGTLFLLFIVGAAPRWQAKALALGMIAASAVTAFYFGTWWACLYAFAGIACVFQDDDEHKLRQIRELERAILEKQQA